MVYRQYKAFEGIGLLHCLNKPAELGMAFVIPFVKCSFNIRIQTNKSRKGSKQGPKRPGLILRIAVGGRLLLHPLCGTKIFKKSFQGRFGIRWITLVDNGLSIVVTWNCKNLLRVEFIGVIELISVICRYSIIIDYIPEVIKK